MCVYFLTQEWILFCILVCASRVGTWIFWQVQEIIQFCFIFSFECQNCCDFSAWMWIIFGCCCCCFPALSCLPCNHWHDCVTELRNRTYQDKDVCTLLHDRTTNPVSLLRWMSASRSNLFHFYAVFGKKIAI